MITKLALQPGDVIAVRTGGFAARMIRFGAALRGWPNLDNHIVGVHHVDSANTMWGIEGRPGGVGWVDVQRYFTGPYGDYAVSNVLQPKSPEQREKLCAIMEQLLKVGYDWDAIAQDAIEDLHIPLLWHSNLSLTSPAHVVCSSLYAWAYRTAGLAYPIQVNVRNIQPASWTQFILEEGWRNV